VVERAPQAGGAIGEKARTTRGDKREESLRVERCCLLEKGGVASYGCRRSCWQKGGMRVRRRTTEEVIRRATATKNDSLGRCSLGPEKKWLENVD